MHMLLDCLTFPDNELYRFLNASNNLQGKIILGKYKKTGTLDYTRLKELVICDKLQEDNVNYK